MPPAELPDHVTRIPGQDALPEGLVRVGPLMELPAVVRDLGFDARKIFPAVGLDPTQFADPDARVPFVSASALLAQCVTLTGCPHLGLLVGERASISALGLLGFMLQAAPNVGTALQDLANHLSLHDRGATVTLETAGQSASLGYLICLPGVHAKAQIYDLAMVVACKIMRRLCGADWNPKGVHLSRPQPPDEAPYRKYFRAPLRFDAQHTALLFAARWLREPIAGSDSFLYRYLDRLAHDLHLSQQERPAAELRRLLVKALPTHHCSAASLAEQLGMHERTLNRRLRDEGTSFREVLDDVRYEAARQLLSSRRIPVAQIARFLGYADATAFTRAFRRWSGSSPTRWRRERGSPS